MPSSASGGLASAPRPGRGSTTTHGGNAQFTVSLPALVGALPQARDDFAGWLRRASVDGEDASDLSVVFSELVANAVSASGRSARVEARAWQDGTDVVLEVTNTMKDGAPHVSQRWDMADELRKGGRGLMIVRAYVDQVEVGSSDQGGVVVRCRRHVDVR